MSGEVCAIGQATIVRNCDCVVSPVPMKCSCCSTIASRSPTARQANQLRIEPSDYSGATGPIRANTSAACPAVGASTA